MVKMIGLISEISNNIEISSKLYNYCKRISILESENIKNFEGIGGMKELINHMESNLLGKVVFCCPELGRWSMAGGLGVMVDELTQGN